MSNILIETITSKEDSSRHRSIDSLLSDKKSGELLKYADELEAFRKSSTNLYHKVRASLFLFVVYRFYLDKGNEFPHHGEIPFEGVQAAFKRDFEKSINIFLKSGGKNSSLFSAIADSYHKLAFDYLLAQVKLSISQCDENHDLYAFSSLDDYPFRAPPLLTTQDSDTGLYPVGFDASPVRLDPSHSGWSDIFFLGMDFPEGARVVNLSVNLKVHGSEGPLLPPSECYCRFIREPIIRLTSIDLHISKDISDVKELFSFGNDHLSLLKAGVVASGIIPPSYEKLDIHLNNILHKLLGKPGGIEIVTRVNSIPKGSRLAVSTTLLATIITRLMRFSGQINKQTGLLTNRDRRIVASRAILGEWLGGSGGGWQDSGGLWPGIKLITGVPAHEGQPEYTISRGCLLPEHRIFSGEELSKEAENNIHNSLVLIHGGISQNVGPVLEMVTEKYLLKYEKEWRARKRGIELYDKIVSALKSGNMKELGRLTTMDWEEALQPVIPWINNAFTQELIERIESEFPHQYWGFLMLGGMSGGGMAFIVDPSAKEPVMKRIGEIMLELKAKYGSSFPFIIDPILYDFEINHEGITAHLYFGKDALLPEMPGNDVTSEAALSGAKKGEEEIKAKYGFDADSHDYMKSLLKKGEIGLAQNRLSADSVIEDVLYDDLFHLEQITGSPQPPSAKEYQSDGPSRDISLDDCFRTGEISLKANETAVVSFSGGMGSRWSGGSAVVKSINPFVRIQGKYRSFIETHLAKTIKTGTQYNNRVQHVFTTSYLTHEAVARYLESFDYFGYKKQIYLSPSQSIGHRVYPMERDLNFLWEEQLQQQLADNVQRVQDDSHRALIDWAKSKGEGDDYSENKPILRFNPLGHWYEIPNLIKNNTLAQLIIDNPGLKYLLCHNIDTMGVWLDPTLLGLHIIRKPCLTFEVTPRRIEDAGGGLCRLQGHVQLIEGMALPREEDEYRLSYYNTLTNWITIDSLLAYIGLDRDILLKACGNPELERIVSDAILRLEKKIPTYVTIKNVNYIWGKGQEDLFPVAQFEKLWGDMTSLRDLKVEYAAVSRYRGQQLKEPALLDFWANDGSLDYVKDTCIFR